MFTKVGWWVDEPGYDPAVPYPELGQFVPDRAVIYTQNDHQVGSIFVPCWPVGVVKTDQGCIV